MGQKDTIIRNLLLMPVYIYVAGFLFALSVHAAPTVVATIPQATHAMITEQVASNTVHSLVVSNIAGKPDYKYQFLTGGLRLLIDRKDGFGWLPLVSQVQTAPEYMKQSGANGNFTWNSYGLLTNTSGSDVLDGYDKQVQGDGSVHLVRTYSTTEEGVAETLTETWVVPFDTEELGAKGPKVTYEMTKNRGIVVTKGVNEGTWRMRWSISGIADVNADSNDMKDSENWPIRKKNVLKW